MQTSRPAVLLSALTIVVLSTVIAAPASARPQTDPVDPVAGDVTVGEFHEQLIEGAGTDPVSADSLEAFEDLSRSDQQTVVDVVNDPAFAEEFLDFVVTVDEPGPGEPAVVESSELYPGVVEYESSADVQAGTADIVGLQSGFKAGAGHRIYYPAYSTQTLRASSTSVVLGVTITQLNIWVTFRTGSQGIPKTALSSGSSATNYNFFIVISNQNLTPYASQGLAVAKTVWTGSVLVKGSTFRFDKLDTLKAFSGGLYSHTLVNQ